MGNCNVKETDGTSGSGNDDSDLDAKKFVDYSRPGINDRFPNIAGTTQDSDDFDLYDYVGDSWCLLFMHPGDFTPVCTTELGAIAMRESEFSERGVKLVGFSCNDAESHRHWIKDIKAATRATVSFPLFCDPDRSNATWLGIIEKNRNDEGLPLTVRSVYFIDPSKTIRFVIAYPASTGRNITEIIRAIDSVQIGEKHSIATPVDWEKGDKVMVNANMTDLEAEEKFGKKKIEVIKVPSERNEDGLQKHYMRYVNDPSMN